MMAEKFPRRFGRYVLVDRLNSGGMADVYVAKVTGVESFERTIAIKCIRPELAEDDLFSGVAHSMLIDEANLAAQLTHPAIAQIYELGRHNEQLYIAMEFIEGLDLRHIVDRVGERVATSLPIPFAAYVIAKVAEGLDYAHRRVGKDGAPLNLVHRDVSPRNIIVSFEGTAKLVDFGIAKARLRTTKTTAGMLKGKLSYMAPEQLHGAEVDGRTDIFSLGAVLFEVATGRLLFDGTSDYEVLQKVRDAKIPDLAAALPDAPPELVEVLTRALRQDRADRYQHAAEMAKALEPLLIQKRAIFGAKDAAEFMATAFAHELQEARSRPQIRAILDPSSLDTEGASDFETYSTIFEPPSLDPPSIKRPSATLPYGATGQPQEDWAGQTANSPNTWAKIDKRLSQVAGADDDPPVTTDTSTVGSLVPGDPHARPAIVRRGGVRKVALLGAAVLALGLAAIATGYLASDLHSVEEAPRHREAHQPTGPRPGRLRAKAASKAKAEAASAPARAEDEPPVKHVAKFGFLAVTVTGSRAATIFVDGKPIGKAPQASTRVRLGSRVVKVVEKRPKRAPKTKVRKVIVRGKHTKKAPATVVIAL